MNTQTVSSKQRQIQSIAAEKDSGLMSEIPPSTCRNCRFYRPEGRRGGHCQQMGALVRSSWQACALAVPPFVPSWEVVNASGCGR